MAFVTFTLSDIRAAVKNKLDDLDFSNDSIDRAANDFQFELFNNNRIRFMEKNTVLAVSSGATNKTLPTDFMNLINLTVLDTTTQFRDITKRGYYDYTTFMENFANYSVAVASKIYNWTFFGEGVRFSNPTSAAFNVNCDYMRSPVLMVAATDACELPINCRELMTLGTLQRVMRINEDYNESAQEKAELTALKNSFIKNYGRGGAKVGGQIIKSNRVGRRGRDPQAGFYG